MSSKTITTTPAEAQQRLTDLIVAALGPRHPALDDLAVLVFDAREKARLRDLAATCYAGLVAECGLSERWADVFLAASEGRNFNDEDLLPFAAPANELLDRSIETLDMLVSGLEWNIEHHPTTMNQSDDEALAAAKEAVADIRTFRGA